MDHQIWWIVVFSGHEGGQSHPFGCCHDSSDALGVSWHWNHETPVFWEGIFMGQKNHPFSQFEIKICYFWINIIYHLTLLAILEVGFSGLEHTKDLNKMSMVWGSSRKNWSLNQSAKWWKAGVTWMWKWCVCEPVLFERTKSSTLRLLLYLSTFVTTLGRRRFENLQGGFFFPSTCADQASACLFWSALKPGKTLKRLVMEAATWHMLCCWWPGKKGWHHCPGWRLQDAKGREGVCHGVLHQQS